MTYAARSRVVSASQPRGRGVRRAAFLAVVLALVAGPAAARMYQWVSPTTGTVQLSGEPPAWYRGHEGGPRVRVFDGGNLVDDTAIKLPRGQRETLRAAAFHEAEERQRAEALKRLERAARREQRVREEQARLAEARREGKPDTATDAKASAGTGSDTSALPAAGELDDQTVARLKAIIAEFDRRGGGRNSQTQTQTQ